MSVRAAVCVFAETPDWGAHLPIPPKRYFISEPFTIQGEQQSLGYACLHSSSTGPSRTSVAVCGKSKRRVEEPRGEAIPVHNLMTKGKKASSYYQRDLHQLLLAPFHGGGSLLLLR